VPPRQGLALPLTRAVALTGGRNYEPGAALLVWPLPKDPLQVLFFQKGPNRKEIDIKLLRYQLFLFLFLFSMLIFLKLNLIYALGWERALCR